MTTQKHKLIALPSNREALEVELVEKLKAKTLDSAGVDELLFKLKPKKGHLKSANSGTVH